MPFGIKGAIVPDRIIIDDRPGGGVHSGILDQAVAQHPDPAPVAQARAVFGVLIDARRSCDGAECPPGPLPQTTRAASKSFRSTSQIRRGTSPKSFELMADPPNDDPEENSAGDKITGCGV